MSERNGGRDANGSDAVGRRDYLKTAAGTVAVGGFAGIVSGADYETIVADGQTIFVDAGETWSNKLIDFGNRNDITIIAKEADWTIRDVGFEGTMPPETIFGVADTGNGTSRIENVYVGEGDVSQDPGERGIAIWVDPDHDGHLDVVDVNFHVPGNNGIYGSAPGYNGAGGTIHIDSCYAIDNHHTAYRLAADGDEIRNSVAEKSGHRTANRGIWIWDPGTVEIRDTHVPANGEGYALVARDGTTVDCYDLQYDADAGIGGSGTVDLDAASGTSPQAFVPDGVPTSGEEAASGGSSGGGGGDDGGDPPEPPVVEDFERSDPLADYGGATHLFGTTSGAYEGSQALVNDGGDYGSAVSTSGLNAYPSRGEEVHVHFTNAAADNFVGFHFFAQSEQDNPDSYSVGIGNSGGWRMWRHEGGSVTEIAYADLPASEQIDGWYRAEVRSDSSTIYADLYDDSTDELLASIQADDATYSSGGVGFRSRGNGEAWDYTVLADDSDPAVIEDFERSDPLAEYGGATSLYSTTASTVYEGSQSLVNDGGDYGSVVSTGGLADYPERGEQASFYFSNATDDNFVGFHFFAQSEQDNPDSYSVGIGNSGGWRMWRHEGGSVTEIAYADLPASEQTDGWYRADVWSDSTTVYADLYDAGTGDLLASIQADDTTYSSGGIGFRSRGNGEAWDYVRR